MRRYLRGSLVSVVLLVAVALPASAVDDIVIPINTVVRSAEGVLTQLKSVDVEPELVGSTCPVRAEAGNNRSVHPGSDLIISTGSDSTTLFDVEGVGNGVTVATSDLTLGDTLTVTLRMGADRVFSGGITVTVACSEAPTPKPETTTSTKPATTTSTKAATTTTTEAPTTPTEATTTPTEATTTSTKPESPAPTQTRATTTPTTGATTTSKAPDVVTSSSTTPPNTAGTAAPEETTTTVDTEVLGVQIERGGDELPLTGASTELLTALGFTLVATGLMVRRVAREN